MTRNPWLDVTEADYVGHMESPAVGQLPVLRRIFGDVLAGARPRRVLILGCTTGAGLEHVDPAATAQVTGVDINATFLASLERRFAAAGFALETVCADVAALEFPDVAYDLVHAALILEYTNWRALIPRVARALAPGGTFSVVVQRPAEGVPAVTPTAYAERLNVLESVFTFVPAAELIAAATACGLTLLVRHVEPVGSGKSLETIRLAKPRGAA